MRALISGANGFVGPNLCAHLLAQGDEVFAFGIGSLDTLPGAVTAFVAEIRDPAAVQQVLDTVRPEIVYHLAAISSVRGAAANPRLTLEVNVDGTFNLCDAAMRLPHPPRILNVSTSEVYSDREETVTEDSAVRPSSVYAITKAMAELIPGLFPGADYVTVRPFNHSGPGQAGGFVLASFASQIAGMEAGLVPPVLQVGDLDVERDFLDVRDVVRAYRLLAVSGSAGHVYNIASGRAYSIAAVIEMFRAVAKVSFEIQVDPRRQRPKQRQRIVGDAAKLRAATGWQPLIPLQTTVHDLLVYWRTVRNKTTTASKTSNA